MSHEFVRLPRYLLLHIKRFDDQFSKINNRISYPALLDIKTEGGDKQLLGNTRYALMGLTVHQGTINAGHYIAYVKRRDKWYCFNDERILVESERSALGQ